MTDRAEPRDRVRFSIEIRAAYPSRVGLMEDFERQVEAWESRFGKARTGARWEEGHRQRDGALTARRQVAHLAASTAVRVVDLAEGLTILVNAGRTHAAYPVARSLMESAAVQAYVANEVIPRILKGRTDQVSETLRRLTTGMDPGIGMGQRQAPIRVSKIVDALVTLLNAAVDPHALVVPDLLPGEQPADEESLGVTFRRLYSFVTDHAHPNHHSVHLTSRIDDDAMMEWDRAAGWRDDDLGFVLASSWTAMWGGGEALDRVLKESQHRLVLDRRAP